MEKIVEYALDDAEKAMFDKSAAAVRETHDALKNLVTF
jgi:malate/lactate dehydrogenase